MADELETYVKDEFASARSPIDEIRRLTQQVGGVFVAAFDHSGESWPYELVTGQALPTALPKRSPSSEYSFSTVAMIAYALSLLTGAIERSSLAPVVQRDRPLESRAARKHREEYAHFVNQAIGRLETESGKLAVRRGRWKRLPAPRKPLPALTHSWTFGWDDPFTLNWLLDVVRTDPNRATLFQALCDKAAALTRRVLTTPYPGTPGHVLQVGLEEDVEHAFPLLRVLQLRATLERFVVDGVYLSNDGFGDVAGARDHLFQRVHHHLSESQIPDGNFDPGELAFALEGWILTSTVEPDLAVVDRAFEVLKERQDRNPYWRPARPFKATAQGLILLPQSVEIANALLRICATVTLTERSYFSNNVDLFDSYRRWLFSRLFHGSVNVDGKLEPLVGWESEHTHRGDRIHLWQTSQVLIFLHHYAAMLQAHLAEKLLSLARLSPVLVESEKLPADDWASFRATEPFTGAAGGSRYCVYESIEAEFINPRLPGQTGEAAYSMILYGPPGTGKSTIAEKLSYRLGYRFVTVTPSDFITSGGEAVEARTKAIFTVLGEQSDLVVLFDEIDHLLLDRNSELYREQGDVFKLLTPGMLTKLSDLAKRRRIIFVVATNYFERIDAAIRRPGRIDARYLVLPPDAYQRREYLSRTDLLGDAAWSSLPSGGAKVVDATARFTYVELRELVRRVRQQDSAARGAGLEDALLEAIRYAPPMAQAPRYVPRLEAKPGGSADAGATVAGATEKPWEEYGLLAYLDLEAGESDDDVKQALKKCPDLNDQIADAAVVQKLMSWLDE